MTYAGVAYRLDGWASGTRHALEKPWDSMPIAVLLLVVMFANPTTAASSTIAAAPSWASSRSDSWSVTRGGVSVMASAYSITSRSSGVNTDDSRHLGTWLALASSR